MSNYPDSLYSRRELREDDVGEEVTGKIRRPETMDSDKLDRDFEHEGTAYTGKLRKQEGGGGWMFMAFKDDRPFGPALPNIEAGSADAAMDQGIDGFITVMKEQ